jgi:hypothetical protein
VAESCHELSSLDETRVAGRRTACRTTAALQPVSVNEVNRICGGQSRSGVVKPFVHTRFSRARLRTPHMRAVVCITKCGPRNKYVIYQPKSEPFRWIVCEQSAKVSRICLMPASEQRVPVRVPQGRMDSAKRSAPRCRRPRFVERIAVNQMEDRTQARRPPPLGQACATYPYELHQHS